MSRLIVDWLNNEVELSRQITNIDEDFRDGYLFGELLKRYNQIVDFDDTFIPRSTPDAKINNFCLLERAFRDVGVAFNTKIAMGIMNGKPNIALQVLSEMRGVLESIKKNSKLQATLMAPHNYNSSSILPASLESTTKRIVPLDEGDTNKILKVIKAVRPKYDQAISSTFENTIRTLIDNPNDLMIEKVIQRFTDHKIKVMIDQANYHDDTFEVRRAEQMRRKDVDKQRKEHIGEFTAAWELINTNQWKDNQRKAHVRRELEKKLVADSIINRQTKKAVALNYDRNDTFSSIDAFDKRLENEVFREDPSIQQTIGNSIKKTVSGPPGCGIPDLTYIDNELLKTGFELAQKQVKENHEDKLNKQQIRDKRRRRFTRERENLTNSTLQSAAESEIVLQLLNISQMEEAEQRSIQKVDKYKSVMMENRLNRDNLLNTYDDDANNAMLILQKDDCMKEKEWVISDRIKSQADKINALATANTLAEKKASTEIAEETLDLILDLCDWVLACRDVGNYIHIPAIGDATDGVTPITKPIFDDLKALFSSHLPIGQALPYSEPTNVFQDLPYSLSEKPTKSQPDWILGKSFQSYDIFKAYDDADEVKTSDIIMSGSVDGVPSHRLVSEYLATYDFESFVALVAHAGLDGYGEVPTLPEAALSEAASQLSTPAWLATTAPRYIFGETVAAMRTVAAPLPADPLPAVTVLCKANRFVVCGVSDTARAWVANSIAEASEGRTTLISVEDLLLRAVDSGLAARSIDVAERTAYDNLCIGILNQLERGSEVADSMYVDLIISRLLELSEEQGYVLEDFPCTQQQAVLLVQALSGINYDSHKPQQSDARTPFASLTPADEGVYDRRKCGLDKVIYVEAGGVESSVSERVRSRLDLGTGQVVYVDESTETMDGLQDLFTPLRPVQTVGIEKTFAEHQAAGLKAFAEKLGIYHVVDVASFGSLEEAAKVTASIIFPSPAEDPPIPEPIADSNELSEGEPTTADAASESAVAEESVAPAEDVKPPTPALPAGAVSLHQRLAIALSGLWAASEDHSRNMIRTFYASLRDMRCHVVQRRRILSDAVNSLLVRRDDRQTLLDEFSKKFNDIDNDFRFDPDCKAELHLRSHEFNDTLWEMSDTRRKEVDLLIDEFSRDAASLVTIHRLRCEGANILQSEFSRFNTSLHVLFDFAKAVTGFDSKTCFDNSLEETLPADGEAAPSDPKAKGAKDAGKAKGKDAAPAAPVPFRPVVVPIILASSAMGSLPEPSKAEEEVVDPKAKKAAPPAKGKKGEDAPVSTNLFEAAEKAVLDGLQKWTKGAFSVNRALYLNNEAVSIIIENAVWHEVERLKFAIIKIKETVLESEKWTEDNEREMLELMKSTTKRRYLLETAVNNRLIDMIGDLIDNSEPIKNEWLITNDAISVMKWRLLLPDPEPNPIPEVETFYTDRWNGSESDIFLNTYLWRIQVGGVVLEHDVRTLLDQIMSSVGPVGCYKVSAKPSSLSMYQVQAPAQWRKYRDMLEKQILPITEIKGLDTHLGVVALDRVESLVQAVCNEYI